VARQARNFSTGRVYAAFLMGHTIAGDGLASRREPHSHGSVDKSQPAAERLSPLDLKGARSD